jgi:hypothetical protein
VDVKFKGAFERSVAMDNFEHILNDRREPKFIKILRSSISEKEMLSILAKKLKKLEDASMSYAENEKYAFKWFKALTEVVTVLSVLLWGSIKGDVFLVLSDSRMLAEWASKAVFESVMNGSGEDDGGKRCD